ncbi:hypothetical protein CDL12_28397 [Handroanthus impetiginosus]|uniref:UspA domain-containing protein n=1 Tax=Handroanthus impetiginosus TaxID=429701 RepID=A0A2G9G1C9_9LAMI|nr:hypothetical protein CDL12_28397 [Handroanthus impetiginosus]
MEGGTPAARKVMVVADPSRESAGALQYALSHAVLDNDTLILLHVDNPNAWKNPLGALFKNPTSPGGARIGGIGSFSSSFVGLDGGAGGGEADFLDGMKRVCVTAKPKLKVVVEKAETTEGKDKASVILAHCEASKIDLLIVGQRRNTLSNAILGPKRGLSLRGFDTADYLVENSKCTCVAVQKKGQNGGYLLNSKTHKNFWLLA